jgi:hypothetical protein
MPMLKLQISPSDICSLMYLIVQIDSWWYYKGPENGVKNWTAKPSIFPNGIEAVAKKTGWPIEAHNRWWSPVTDYAKQNGGKFEFIVESEASLPVEEEFWDFLFSSSKETWNLLVYEQDWLDVAVTRLQALRSTMSVQSGTRTLAR